ncbi:MAG: hypothetical protein A4E28_00192 [Methanocella sp. PtaU1.Bin125]|nr:MAG: hypothetical protein A4E28_00192 [Methanocella sp. PtaU1.Bin125]
MDDIERYLDFFGLGRDVSPGELKAARNRFLKTYHPDSAGQGREDMAKMTNIAYEKISAFIKNRDRRGAAAGRPPAAEGLIRRPEDEYYRQKADAYLRRQSRQHGAGLSPYRPGSGDLYGDEGGLSYKRCFVDAVLNYTYCASIIKDVGYTCGWYLNVFPLRVLAAWVYQVYPDWDGNRKAIQARIRGEDYRKLFVRAVGEYAKEKRCTVKDALLAFRIPASKYYYWKSCK